MAGWVRFEPGRGTIEPDVTGDWHGPAAAAVAARRWILVMLMPLTIMFLLVISAYLMRRTVADWQALTLPWHLFLSTALLVGSSAAFEWARRAVAIADLVAVRRGLMVAGALAFAFLVSQYLSWQVLRSGGHYLATNPANSFFYMMTALHALHLIGGLVAWGVTQWHTREEDLPRLEVNVSLCAIYWHFLLAVWLVLFGVLLLFS
jgi:cytochrome c oxidase subunit III